MENYNLSTKATIDISDIYEYGIFKFGINQARLYLQEMETCFKHLCTRLELRRSASYLKTGLYRYKFKSHVIFYATEDNGIFVIRVLGQHMDFERHL